MNSSCWAIQAAQRDVEKILAISDLGGVFAGMQIKPKLLPALTKKQKNKRKRENKARNRQNKWTKTDAENSGCSKEMETYLRHQLAKMKKERDEAVQEATGLKIEAKEKEYKLGLR